MKKIGLSILGALLVWQVVAVAKELKVTVVSGNPSIFLWVKHLQKTFIPTVDKKLKGSGHSIKWSEQYGGALAKPGEELETVEEGLAEIGIVASILEPSKLAPQNISFYTPFVTTDFNKMIKTMTDLQMNDPIMTKAWANNGLKYIGYTTMLDGYLLFTNFPVKKVSDMKGRKIAGSPSTLTWLEGTGAVGVLGGIPTYYNQVKTGVVDGVLVFASAAVPNKLYEVAPHVTEVGFGAQFPGGLAVNKEWFDALDKKVQKALIESAQVAEDAFHQDLNANVDKFMQIMKDKGAKVNITDMKFRKEWVSKIGNPSKAFIKNLEKQGINGKELVSNYMQALRKAGLKPMVNWDKE